MTGVMSEQSYQKHTLSAMAMKRRQSFINSKSLRRQPQLKCLLPKQDVQEYYIYGLAQLTRKHGCMALEVDQVDMGYHFKASCNKAALNHSFLSKVKDLSPVQMLY